MSIISTPVSHLSRQLFAMCAILALLIAGTALAEHHEESSADRTPTVLVTGANRGLGLEFSRQYSEAGWSVIGTARSPERADELNGLDVEVLQLDVTDRDSIAALVESLDGRPIDLLINNAGIFPVVNRLEDIDADDYTRTLMVNTVGPMLVTQALLPNLRAGMQKRIVGITSRLGSTELSGGNYYGYRESKAALNMFAKTLAGELGPEGFVSLAVHPGWARTDMGGANATQSAEEAVTGMRAVIDSAGADQNGAFIGFDGETVPW